MAVVSNAIQNLHQGLNGAALRQKTIAGNVANIDTPNYKARRTHFQHALNDAETMEVFRSNKTDDRHFDFKKQRAEPFTTVDADHLFNHNGNSVDLDLEMSMMASNQLYYHALVDRLDGQFSSLKTAIRGGN